MKKCSRKIRKEIRKEVTIMTANSMSRGAAKISKVNHTSWFYLSTGERVMKLGIWSMKLATLVGIGIGIIALILAIYVAVNIWGGMTGAVTGQIQRSWDYHHRWRGW
jgi:hypothetical protein